MAICLNLILIFGLEATQPKSSHCEFVAFNHCSSRDKAFLICYMILQDHVIKRSCDKMFKSPSTKSPSYKGWLP